MDLAGASGGRWTGGEEVSRGQSAPGTGAGAGGGKGLSFEQIAPGTGARAWGETIVGYRRAAVVGS
jgi:hypothetical protein